MMFWAGIGEWKELRRGKVFSFHPLEKGGKLKKGWFNPFHHGLKG
jgi:hypothetical protein